MLAEIPFPFGTATFVSAALVVLGAYTIYGISGFGSALVSIPLLAHLLPLEAVVPLVVLLDCVAAVDTTLRLRPHVRWPEVRPLLLPMTLGILVGAIGLANLPGKPLLVALGVFVTANGAWRLSRRTPARRISRAWAPPVGFAGGLFGALFGAGGPLYVVYVGSRVAGLAQFRATMAAIFTLSTSLRILLFVTTGLLATAGLWVAALALFPASLAGAWLGRRIHPHVPDRRIGHIISALLIASGVSLIARGLA